MQVDGHVVELRTDFVAFRTANAALLIYSVRDSRVGRAQLITAFPVSQSFIDAKTAARADHDHDAIQRVCSRDMHRARARAAQMFGKEILQARIA